MEIPASITTIFFALDDVMPGSSSSMMVFMKEQSAVFPEKMCVLMGKPFVSTTAPKTTNGQSDLSSLLRLNLRSSVYRVDSIKVLVKS